MTGEETRTPPHPADPAPAPVPRRRFHRARAAGGGRSQGAPPWRGLRWLRVPGYVVLCWIALGISLAGTEQMGRYAVDTELAVLTAFAQGAAVILALWRPVPAWALSLAGTAVAAVAARPSLQGHPLPGPAWPWNASEVLAHSIVFLFLALRVHPRVSFAVLAGTGVTTWVVQGLIGGATYTSTGVTSVAIFGAVVLVGSAFRGLGEARTQLVEQETITAEERARRTLLEERNRIARELHDVVAHHMSVISIQAQVAPHLVDNPSEELKENLSGIRQNALEALTELRRVLGVLRSENPEDPYGLGAAGTGTAPDTPQPTLDRLDALVDNTRAAGLDVVTEVHGEARGYPPGMELSAYRIVQEALSNALRHAPGSRVRVALTHDPRGLHLEVTNSRPAGPVRPSPGAGHGLLGMRERVAMLGGHVTAHPTLHGGFTVSAFLPGDGATTPPDDDPGTPEDLELIFPDDPLPTTGATPGTGVTTTGVTTADVLTAGVTAAGELPPGGRPAGDPPTGEKPAGRSPTGRATTDEASPTTEEGTP
ncbi:sensor histidine kinase [Streptomyces sp. NPDC052015]|uniref:sensor histidine kinase n=1 Tax=Streptomyces sp. NPDC052015 TaxID=3154755 RepID=UPI00342337F4